MAFSEEAAITRILAGDTNAYAELVERYQDRAMMLALRILRDRQDAEEALQDAFVRAYQSLKSFRREANFSTWFYRILYNVCLTALRKRGEKFFLSIDEEKYPSIEAGIADELHPHALLEADELRELLDKAIEKLPGPYRAIFTLFYVQDMSYEEICAVTGLPLGTVKTQLFRARNILKKALEKNFSFQEGIKQ